MHKEWCEKNKELLKEKRAQVVTCDGCGEQYITPYAIRLGATTSEIGILATVPAFIGSIFQLVGAKIVDKYKIVPLRVYQGRLCWNFDKRYQTMTTTDITFPPKNLTKSPGWQGKM